MFNGPSIDPDNLKLPPITANEVDYFVARQRAQATRCCDVVKGCTVGVGWMLNLHECHQVAACDGHYKSLLYTYKQGVTDGWVRCPDCGEEFTKLHDIMTARKI
ncbi:hypothetical protein FDI14_gp069 [Mycobacterium phage SirDuracell]|uniref:Uncharacterized protein n=5 Tax=Viruses TaxID=10239 RepID=G1D5T4_9CAUD|nr:hypothetical protein GOKU_68 [Mycobacterium phage Goku]YP_009591230.1 hypothetical protein FDG56_gp070 [Mycobacterium phage Bask21]YP_009591608.1 hypothetical protein FDG60_gp068 [Mycobacterium phage Eureka]YP_009607999.1 hypothetical protein FDI14_gp069 [Mycobacterium phage SirDuracell]ATN92634.1 hypothetical protein SEA_YASSJOHNNY_67 [Mycobacterium phage YassJohnny]AVI03315.1 hypothetical protein SEA_ASRIEL_69 [Mycobacterium phage Asriel]AVI03451.1 hypothetical protein SEA_BARBARIAN_69 [